MGKILIAVVLGIALISASAHAASKNKAKVKQAENVTQQVKKEPIQLFGGFDWEDGLPIIVNKLLNMNSVERIVLFSVNPDDENAIDLKKIPRESVAKVLINFCGMQTSGQAEFNSSLDQAPFYQNNQNEKISFYETGSSTKLLVTPIIISGVPFTMEFAFQYSYGLPLKHPEGVVVSQVGKQKYAISLVANHLYLTSNSPMLADNDLVISKNLLTKYGQYEGKLSYDGKNANGKVEDAVGTSLSADISNTGAQISYSSNYYSRKLDEEYRKFLANMEKQINKGKQDMGGAL